MGGNPAWQLDFMFMQKHQSRLQSLAAGFVLPSYS
jgi:hypothetical protein